MQGCYRSLRALVDKIGFRPGVDQVWLTGDLVNRGPDSLNVLRWVMEQGDAAVSVLGNHDLHLLARAAGVSKAKKKDTLDEVLNAPDANELIAWLQHRPLLHQQDAFCLVHAGLPPNWTLEFAKQLASEVENALRGKNAVVLFQNMYGAEPRRWRDDLQGHERRRFVVNAFTRMRYVAPDGTLDFEAKGTPSEVPPGLVPWFDMPDQYWRGLTVLFGHWSALGLYVGDEVIGLDTGCVWGGKLTAIRLEDRRVFQVASQDGAIPMDD